ncbi:MAG TPA: DUF3102 domain-containing protein [Verrucomicrobiae bacterium]|nr:DUF3102 domain-containing protein [Verrucomicrobiae bacterium]
MIHDPSTSGAGGPKMAVAHRRVAGKPKKRDRALEKLAAKIRDAVAETESLIGKFGTAIQVAAEHACEVGRLLSEAKTRVAHGAWEPWLAENVPALSPRTARRWMSAAKRPSLADLDGAGPAAISVRGAVRLLADDPEKVDASGGNTASMGTRRDPGREDDDAKVAPPESKLDDGHAARAPARAPAPSPAPKEADSPSPAASGSTTAEDAGEEPRTTGPGVEGIVNAAIALREMIGRVWGAGVRLTIAQSRELHATEIKLHQFREKMGGAEGKALSEAS